MNKPKGFNRNKASCNSSQDDLELFQQNPQQEWEEQQQVFSCIKVKLNQSVADPNFYSRLTNRIEQLTEADLMELYIDTDGGNADGMLALVDAIENTPAEVVAVLTGRVYSAGSVIALHCPQIQVGPYARMMIHAGRGGLFGKDNEVEANFEFNKKFYKKFFYDTYKHFLTDQEIEEVLNGRDIWLDSEQILERLERKNNLLLKEQKKLEVEAKKKSKPSNKSVLPKEDDWAEAMKQTDLTNTLQKQVDKLVDSPNDNKVMELLEDVTGETRYIDKP